MKIYVNNSIEMDKLELLFTDCFNKLKDSDSEKFSDDNNQSFREWFGIDNLKDYLKYSYIIVAEDERKLVGGAIVGMQNPLSFPDGKKYELFILGVLPKYRNKGVGKRIIKEMEDISKKTGASSIILNTHELMTSTQKFYTDLGYEKIGTLEKYYGNGNAVFFSKTL
ncbi:MAG TPA: GNAT family N-acetyltransferase [Candidatus Dojkabacteria bacterium]|nr:GNAT family N-acetyltransferase [Candidatus Dojkabacteria bacterium]